MSNHETRETRETRPQPDTELRSIVTDVVVPLAQSGITVGGAIVAAKVAAKGKNDDKK